ncbi:MAG: ABC transporter permease [Candidatus Zixiibacteriota bacterium]|nr:MAG: ABC transporter permease [candidate division Zixibacteria bacterium]
MFRNFLIISFRNLTRNKTYSLINIAGLAIGMACCLMIMLWVQNEYSYDRFHENADRIYRLCIDGKVSGRIVQAPISNSPAGPAMVNDFPEVINTVRTNNMPTIPVKYQDRVFFEENIIYADNSIFDVFTFPLISKSEESPLARPYTIVITENTAKRYFGDENPLGKTMRLNNELDYTVTGIVENPPTNSLFDFEMLCSFETRYAENRELLEEWINFSYFTYLLLDENADYKKLEAKFPSFIEDHMGERLAAFGIGLDYFLQPLTSVHLFSSLEFEESENIGNITYVYLFSGIALFVLLIACFNFINLTTARAAARAKEVGLRKTLGARKSKLISQFLVESIIYSVFSMLLALLILEIALPVLNSIAGSELSLTSVNIPSFLLTMLIISIGVGILAGSYPAFFLSAFSPVRVLKGNLRAGGSRSKLRSVLVIGQFIISITLIAGTFFIYKQINYMKNKKLGFDKEQLLVMRELGESLQQSPDLIRDKLSRIPGVEKIALGSVSLGSGTSASVFVPEGYAEDQGILMNHIYADYNYIPTLGIEIAQGRNFSSDIKSDVSDAAIINETAVKLLGWENPIGKTFKIPDPGADNSEWETRKIVGVVKDFHIEPLNREIGPVFFINANEELSLAFLRLSTVDISGTVDQLKSKWGEITPDQPMNFFFVDDEFDKMYRAEERMGKLAFYFSILAIFIGCMGLFGISSYAAEQRTKEIGIRKVLGATVPNILRLLSREVMVLIAVSFVIAWPIAYYALNRWLQNFAYRINLDFSIFIFAGLIALAIAMLTISFQSIRAALANPVKSLKYE